MFPALVDAARTLPPRIALVLGSGLGAIAQHVQPRCTVAYDAIPGLSATSVEGHKGCLTLGDWNCTPILLFEGRLHYYEGHPWTTVIKPVQLAAALGARILILTNSAGGIHRDLAPGCIMALRDHIDWTRPHTSRKRERRTSPYCSDLLRSLQQAADRLSMKLHQGSYAAVTGPCYETPAEIRALRVYGADAVGMSTAREIEAGHALGMRCAALSCITNRAAGLGPDRIHHEEVKTNAAAQSERMAELIEAVFQEPRT